MSAGGLADWRIAPSIPSADDPPIVDLVCRLHAPSGVLTVEGVLDADTAAAVTALDGDDVVIRTIDARRVELLAAAGVTALIRATKGRPTPVLASAAVRRTIECCGVEDLLVITPPRG